MEWPRLHKLIPNGNISLCIGPIDFKVDRRRKDVGYGCFTEEARSVLGKQSLRSQSEYRKFRRGIIDSLLSEDRRDRHIYPAPHRIAALRAQITQFRSHLQWGWRELLKSDPDAEGHLKKALRIPANMNVLSNGHDIFLKFLLAFLPIRVAVNTVKIRLSTIGTYEGRELLFLSQFKRTLPVQDLYTKSFDYALRNLELPKTFDAFRNMRDIDINWMKACVKLGARSYADVSRVFYRDDGHANDGVLISTLVRSNVITTLDQLTQIPSADRFYSRHDLDSENIQKFQQVVELLKSREMDAASIMKLVNVPLHRFCSERLAKALLVFNFSGADLTLLFEQGGANVLFAEAHRWRYLRDVLGVRTASEALSLRRLIVSNERQCVGFVQAMRRSGAGIEALSICQSILLSVADKPQNEAKAINALNILISPPYAFTYSDLAKTDAYLVHENDLSVFLRVLVEYGFEDINAILAFQRCYKQMRPQMLAAWLEIAEHPMSEQSPEVVSEWVVAASEGGHLDALQYLKEVGELTTSTHLHQGIKLAPLGRVLLQYLRETRSKTGLKSLLHWYYYEASGVRELKLWHIDAVSRVLLDDGFQRKDFNLHNSNRACVNAVLNKRINDEIGKFPYQADESTRESYHINCQALQDKLAEEIAPRLKSLLLQTDGFLSPSLMPHIDDSPAQLTMCVKAINELIGDLTLGAGPASKEISALELELICMVYRSDSEIILKLWPKLLEREHDVPSILRSNRYQMNWRPTEIQLAGQVDRRGLRALLVAIEFAARFRRLYREDMHDACRHLSPKRLQDGAKDVQSLAQHLGVLLALSGGDSNVDMWLDNGKRNIEELIEAGPRVVELIESLEKLLVVDIKDALATSGSAALACISSNDAFKLASKLDFADSRNVLNAPADLRNAIDATRDVVLTKYEQWITAQRKKLVAQEVSGMCSTMLAMVSKSPAAFFAKSAAGICSRYNTDMWAEKRNAHLLVFAPGGKRLTGMALVYLQKIKALDAKSNTLIIRAINPMPEALASFSVSSIVDSYFDVAIQIAKDVGAAAVAFPHPSGMDFMSNHPSIEKDIKTRFMEQAKSASYLSGKQAISLLERPRRVDETFYTYESESSQGKVEQLFAIWHRVEQVS